MKFVDNIIYNFFIAFGVVIGAAFFSCFGALINGHPPLKTMIDMSRNLKIWAVAAALGGTFTSIEAIELGLSNGEIRLTIKQLLYILSALAGANTGCLMVSSIEKLKDIWFLM